jgi:hypothetical protein
VTEKKRELVLAIAPPKKVSEMTDEELDAFVDEIYTRAVGRLRATMADDKDT